ncbi:MAG TPA: sugar ABC transporter permease, partial [Candidatus Acidoferrum sp.]|nr:sugar ABC transporter permease [Candidatus Acidoferrum sp.]
MAESAAPPRARRVAWLAGDSIADSRQAPMRTILLFLAPALLVYAAFTIYPVLRTFYNSVHTIGPRNVQTFVGLDNFAALLTQDRVFWKAVVNTALFTVVGTIGDVLGGLLLALCLFAKVPLARTLRVVWFTPVLMSYVVVGIIWVWLYDYDWGLVNLLLGWLG